MFKLTTLINLRSFQPTQKESMLMQLQCLRVSSQAMIISRYIIMLVFTMRVFFYFLILNFDTFLKSRIIQCFYIIIVSFSDKLGVLIKILNFFMGTKTLDGRRFGSQGLADTACKISCLS